MSGKTVRLERGPLLDGDNIQREYSTANSSADNHGTTKPLDGSSRADLVWILIALWSAVFLGALDGTIVATLVSPIGSHFDKAHQSSYLGTSYLLSMCCFTPLYGRLSDILGRKGAMLLGLSFFGIGTIFCGLAPSMELLILARFVAGAGGGGIMTVASVVVTDLIPLKKRGLYQGFSNILFGAGSGLGGPLGGFINDKFGWRAAFFLQLPVILFSFTLTAIKVNIEPVSQSLESTIRGKLARIDWLGSLTLVLGVGGLISSISLKTSEELPFSHPVIRTLFTLGVVSSVAFILVEKYWSKEPIMPMRLLTQRTLFAVVLSNFFLSAGAYSMLYNIPLYFSTVRLQSATQAGSHLLPNSIALSSGSIFAGWMMRRTGKYWTLTIISYAIIVLSTVMIALWGKNTSDLHFWLDIVPSGFGGASAITSTLIALVSSVHSEDIAVATGISYLFRTTGQVLGVSLSGTLTQVLLLHSLRKRIRGPDAEDIIRDIRHSTAIIPGLDPHLQKATVDSYAIALRAVFIGQVVVAVITLLCALPIEEFDLPGTREEQAEHDRLRRAQEAGQEAA